MILVQTTKWTEHIFKFPTHFLPFLPSFHFQQATELLRTDFVTAEFGSRLWKEYTEQNKWGYSIERTFFREIPVCPFSFGIINNYIY